MDKYDEKDLFSLIDKVENEKFVEVLEKIPNNEELPIPNNTIESIKQKTFKKIGVHSADYKIKKKFSNIWKPLVASLLILSFLVLFSENLGPAWAKVKQYLQFIPGMGPLCQRLW